MTVWLREQGQAVNRKRVARLMEGMRIEAVYPKSKLSQPGEGHKTSPYLLEGVEVRRVNQVWSTDITYIRMAEGFVYLVAVMDWFSRFALSWAFSVTMELDLCVEALKRAFRRGRPEIFNSDQGSRFTGELESRGIAVSMDGRRRDVTWHDLRNDQKREGKPEESYGNDGASTTTCPHRNQTDLPAP